MARPRRSDACQFHHITSRGNNRRSIYEDVVDREEFYGILDTSVERTGVLCHLDVLMGNHYHLFLQGPMTDVSELLFRVNHRYAVAYNGRHGRINHLFGRRFHCVPVPDLRGAQAVTTYIALNPVRAGFCADPADWPFGSYRTYAGTATPRPHVSTGLITGLFGPGRTLADACAAELGAERPGRPPLGTLLPSADDVTREHVIQAIKIFGHSYEDIARHYGVSVRTLFSWITTTGARHR